MCWPNRRGQSCPELQAMMQALLAERFQLKVKKDERKFRVLFHGGEDQLEVEALKERDRRRLRSIPTTTRSTGFVPA